MQNVPESAWTEDVDDMIAYFHGIVRGVDSSLLDEWERLRAPEYVPTAPEEAAPEPERTITDDLRGFTVLLRNKVFALVRALARKDYAAAAELVDAPPDEPAWTAERLEQQLAVFYEDHSAIRFDPRARGTEHTLLDRSNPERWEIVQKLVDPDDHNDWLLGLTVDLPRAREAGAPMLVLHKLGS